MKSSKVITKGEKKTSPGKAKRLRTQTAEGWRRSVKKICEKRDQKKG